MNLEFDKKKLRPSDPPVTGGSDVLCGEEKTFSTEGICKSYSSATEILSFSSGDQRKIAIFQNISVSPELQKLGAFQESHIPAIRNDFRIHGDTFDEKIRNTLQVVLYHMFSYDINAKLLYLNTGRLFNSMNNKCESQILSKIAEIKKVKGKELFNTEGAYALFNEIYNYLCSVITAIINIIGVLDSREEFYKRCLEEKEIGKSEFHVIRGQYIGYTDILMTLVDREDINTRMKSFIQDVVELSLLGHSLLEDIFMIELPEIDSHERTDSDGDTIQEIEEKKESKQDDEEGPSSEFDDLPSARRVLYSLEEIRKKLQALDSDDEKLHTKIMSMYLEEEINTVLFRLYHNSIFIEGGLGNGMIPNQEQGHSKISGKGMRNILSICFCADGAILKNNKGDYPPSPLLSFLLDIYGKQNLESNDVYTLDERDIGKLKEIISVSDRSFQKNDQNYVTLIQLGILFHSYTSELTQDDVSQLAKLEGKGYNLGFLDRFSIVKIRFFLSLEESTQSFVLQNSELPESLIEKVSIYRKIQQDIKYIHVSHPDIKEILSLLGEGENTDTINALSEINKKSGITSIISGNKEIIGEDIDMSEGMKVLTDIYNFLGDHTSTLNAGLIYKFPVHVRKHLLIITGAENLVIITKRLGDGSLEDFIKFKIEFASDDHDLTTLEELFTDKKANPLTRTSRDVVSQTGSILSNFTHERQECIQEMGFSEELIAEINNVASALNISHHDELLIFLEENSTHINNFDDAVQRFRNTACIFRIFSQSNLHQFQEIHKIFSFCITSPAPVAEETILGINTYLEKIKISDYDYKTFLSMILRSAKKNDPDIIARHIIQKDIGNDFGVEITREGLRDFATSIDALIGKILDAFYPADISSTTNNTHKGSGTYTRVLRTFLYPLQKGKSEGAMEYLLRIREINWQRNSQHTEINEVERKNVSLGLPDKNHSFIGGLRGFSDEVISQVKVSGEQNLSNIAKLWNDEVLPLLPQ